MVEKCKCFLNLALAARYNSSVMPSGTVLFFLFATLNVEKFGESNMENQGLVVFLIAPASKTFSDQVFWIIITGKENL